jgi:MFS transporter, SP family, sugar:H+ symporter
VTGELFPLKARAKCLSFTTASNWLLNWAIAYSTPYLTDSGPGKADLGPKVFFIWGSFCAIAIVFTFTMIYETKSLTLEQVDELYDIVDVAWKSQKFAPAVKFSQIGPSDDSGRRKSLKDHLADQEKRRASAV